MIQVPVLDTYEWQKAVLDKSLSTPPESPVKGSRYIVASNPSGAWHNKPKRIAEYTGQNWQFTEPREGMLTLVKSENILYQYINNKWRDFALLVSSKRRVATYSEDHEISTDEGGMLFVSDAAGEITFTLPSVGSADLGMTFTFARVNKNGTLIIKANDNDHIADSGPGCTIYSNRNDIEYATLTITLIQPDRWGIITGNGTWMTTVIDE